MLSPVLYGHLSRDCHILHSAITIRIQMLHRMHPSSATPLPFLRYFLPIIFMAWFAREEAGAKDHGEAPPLVVLAVTVTALLTLGFFFFNGPVIELEKQLVQGVLQ